MENKMIKVTNGYIDMIMTNPLVQVIVKKQFTNKTSYWIASAFDKLQNEAKVYLNEKQKTIERYAKRYEKDGEEKKNGEVIKSWKKGGMVVNNDQISIADMPAFLKAMSELNEIEIEIGIKKIEFNLEKEPNCPPEEMSILIPLITIKE